MNIILVYTVFFCSIWILMFCAFVWTLIKVPLFQDETKSLEQDTGLWPRLSIIVPACNESEHIKHAITSLLEQDYPNLEIIAINDRSTDGTGEIIDDLATKYDHLKVLHLESIPDGWLGKVNAMNQGVKLASGDWYLFTDADVHFSPGLLKRSIGFVLQEKIDHLALLPEINIKNFWLQVFIITFGFIFLLSSRAALVNCKNSKTSMGIGAFNLVNAAIFRQTPGFEWLRLEPADDYGLGVMVKRAGGKTHFAFADHDLSVPWYGSVGEMFRGLEKNMFGPGAYYSVVRLILLVVILWLLAAAPLVAIPYGVCSGSLPVLLIGAAAVGTTVTVSMLTFAKPRTESMKLLLFPVGLLAISFMFLWSGFQCLRHGGISWRGTHYPLAELRVGQRVKF